MNEQKASKPFDDAPDYMPVWGSREFPADARLETSDAFCDAPMPFPFELFNEHDELKITGPTVGYWQFAVHNFHCIAATVYDRIGGGVTEEDMYTFKVWAIDQGDAQLPADHDNKFWFDLRIGFALAMTRLANAPLGLRSFLLSLRPFKFSFSG